MSPPPLLAVSVSIVDGYTRPMPSLPMPRGATTEWLFEHLAASPHDVSDPPPATGGPFDDDAQLALYCAYELHYRGFDGVDVDWEWEPSLLTARAALERAFLDALVDEVGPAAPASDAVTELRTTVDGAAGPSLSSYAADVATLPQFRELLVHRSAYQLKEADPHSWALPRLSGRAKAAMVEIQADEYGHGRLADMHATLFADTLRGAGLDPCYGAYLDVLPGSTLATTNLISFFGLRRRWRGALVGHLAVFEMTSVEPMARYSVACDRVGLPASARRFFDVHVSADALHEQVATDDLVGGLVAEDPTLGGDVLFGARATLAVERRFADHLLTAWDGGGSSLLVGLGAECGSPAA